MRSFHFNVIWTKANIYRSNRPCFLVTNPSLRVHFLPSRVFKHTDIILVSPERGSGVKYKYYDSVFEFWVSILNWTLPDWSAWQKPFEQRIHPYHQLVIFLLWLTLLGYTIFGRGYSFSSRSKEFRGIMSCCHRLDGVCLLEKREGWHQSMFDVI